MQNELLDVIGGLQRRIQEHAPSIMENEIRTRATLIDPMLSALGWDVSNPEMVTLERSAGKGRADYALHHGDTKPFAVLEAKRLGEDLESHISQMVGYALEEGIPYAGLTDGNRWQLYEVFAPKPFLDKRLLNVTLTEMPAHRCVLELLLLWNPNLTSGQVVEAKQPLVLQGQGTDPTTNVKPPESTDSNGPKPVPPPAGEGWLRLSTFDPPARKRPPLAICFDDGVRAEIKYWKDIPVQVVNWLFTRGALTVKELPVVSGHKSFGVNSTPQQADGSEMRSYDVAGEGTLFINTWISAKVARENARKILEHFHIDPSTVWLLPTED